MMEIVLRRHNWNNWAVEALGGSAWVIEDLSILGRAVGSGPPVPPGG